MKTKPQTIIPYRNWVIEEETDPWALNYWTRYRFYREGSGGEKIYSAESIEEAKGEIDEREN